MASGHLGIALRQLRRLLDDGVVAGLADEQLLDRFVDGRDGAAFEALVARHGPMVLATCRGVLKDAHSAEDAFQATFLTLARKAASLRSADSLGCWLHQVARRAAVEANTAAARRLSRERPGLAIETPDVRERTAGEDDRPILHEEIDRLPERYRAPIVLCYLEGMTHEQAAGHLRWPVGTVGSRLARARELMRGRLIRRGVTASAAVASMAAGMARAAVPASWAREAVEAATGGPASAGVAALTFTITRGLTMTRIKLASTAALAAFALGAAGLLAPGAFQDSGPSMKPAGQAKAPAPAARDTAPASSRPGEVFEIGGLVLTPDHRPVEGASVRLVDIDSPLEAKSGQDGRFLFRVPQSVVDGFRVGHRERYPRMVASAPGFAPGLAWGAFDLAHFNLGWGLMLAEAGPPIEGRIVDLEGRPAVGVRVEAKDLWYSWAGDLTPWIASVKAGGINGIWRELANLPMEPPAVAITGEDGRFRLDGPGRDRVAGLLVSGPSIATETVYVLGRDAPEVRTVDKSKVEPRPFVLHAPRFQHAAAPSRPIEGTLLDKDNGRPIAGVTIRANIDREGDHTMIPGIEARSDDRGHYRLTGLPRAAGYRLFLFPKDSAPYPNTSFVVPASTPGTDPIPFDIALKRGVLVRGRVTDKATGRPVKGFVDAYTFSDNPHAKDFPGFADGYRSAAHFKEDGRFEVVALPGRGILAVRAYDDLYRGGVGAEAIKGPRFGPEEDGEFDTLPERLDARGYHTMAGIDFAPSADPATLEIQVDPGRTISMTAVDPDGKPVGGTRVMGLGDIYPSPTPCDSPTFEVHGYDPSEPRRVTVAHMGRKLIGSVYIKGAVAGAMTVPLRPWGAVAGRVVDDEGRPRPGINLWNTGGIDPKNPEEDGVLPARFWDDSSIVTDADGRFRVEALIPGLKYGASAAYGIRGLGKVFEGLIVAPGESRDLGDLKIIRPAKQ
jgi:RNA polymerase sigma factor (sigma-70 family)